MYWCPIYLVLNKPPQEKNRVVIGLVISQAISYTVILFRSILQGIVHLRMCQQCGGAQSFVWVLVKYQVYMTPVGDLADLQEKSYANVRIVTLQMLHNTWVEAEYRLNIFRAINGSHVEVYGT